MLVDNEIEVMASDKLHIGILGNYEISQLQVPCVLKVQSDTGTTSISAPSTGVNVPRRI